MAAEGAIPDPRPLKVHVRAQWPVMLITFSQTMWVLYVRILQRGFPLRAVGRTCVHGLVFLSL